MDALDDPSRLALAARVEEVADAIGTRRRAAAAAGISPQQLHNLISGKSAPSFLVAGRLAAEAGYDLHWLFTGEGPKLRTAPEPPSPVELDPRLFGRLLDALTKVYQELGVRIGAAELGAIAAEEYKDVAAAAADSEDEQIAMVKLVAARHRRRIKGESLASRKRGA